MARRAKLPATEPVLADETPHRAKPLRIGAPEDANGTDAASYEELLVDVGDLDPYPANPRLERDEGTVDALAEDMSVFGFERRYALTTRRLPNGRLQIVGGHTRFEAALLAGLSQVWVRIFEWDDRTAAEQVLLDNRQRGATPMEIALHSLQMERDGHLVLAQGKADEGLAAFARRLGFDAQNLRRYRRGARVALHAAASGAVTVGELRDRAEHLAAISELEEARWTDLVRDCVTGQLSVVAVRGIVSDQKARRAAMEPKTTTTPAKSNEVHVSPPLAEGGDGLGAAPTEDAHGDEAVAPLVDIPASGTAGTTDCTEPAPVESTRASHTSEKLDGLSVRLAKALASIEVANGSKLVVAGPLDPTRGTCPTCAGTRFATSKREPVPRCVVCEPTARRGQTPVDTADVRSVHLVVAWSALVSVDGVRADLIPVLIVERQEAIEFSTHDGSVLRTTDRTVSTEDLRVALGAVLVEHAKNVLPEGCS